MKSSLKTDPTGYGRLVSDGHYGQAPDGLAGKYDHVRKIWEDQTTRFAVRPALVRLLAGAGPAGLRIADLGCGGGEGWNLLVRVPAGTGFGRGRYLLEPERIAAYHGIDLCPEMVARCCERFADVPRATFAQGDLGDAAAALRGQQPFDLYYNSYGSLSHLDDGALRGLVQAVVAHQPGPCVLMIDVHGQYSPEWPGLWNYSSDPALPRMQPYNMVWMYPPEQRERRLAEQADYRVRYWRGHELRAFLHDIPELAARLDDLTLTDRSVLVGRHMDTGCFHPGVPAIRREVNALFEFNHAADLDRLRPPVLPSTGQPTADAFLAEFRAAWNALVDWFAAVVAGERAPHPMELCQPHGPVPAQLMPGLTAIAESARHLAWFSPGDPEANLLQPQFGLLLRQLEVAMQRGLGCGHGLLATIAIGPRRERR